MKFCQLDRGLMPELNEQLFFNQISYVKFDFNVSS